MVEDELNCILAQGTRINFDIVNLSLKSLCSGLGALTSIFQPAQVSMHWVNHRRQAADWCSNLCTGGTRPYKFTVDIETGHLLPDSNRNVIQAVRLPCSDLARYRGSKLELTRKTGKRAFFHPNSIPLPILCPAPLKPFAKATTCQHTMPSALVLIFSGNI